MKTTFNNDMVAHLWANQSQEHAANGNGSLYFQDDTIYSYGNHFPIARHVDNVVLLTTDTYSVTTTQHMSKVYSAISHKRIFDVTNVLASTKKEHKANFRDNVETILHDAKAITRKRTGLEWSIDNLHRQIANVKQYAEHFKVRDIANVRKLEGIESLDFSALKEKFKNEIAKERQAETKKRDALKAENQKCLTRWLAGEHAYGNFQNLPVELRIKPGDEETVQTSQGASFPLRHAKRAYIALSNIKRTGEFCYGETQTELFNRIRLGHFSIAKLELNTFEITSGCHTVKWDAVERFAKSQEW